jgi:hypothetical protein
MTKTKPAQDDMVRTSLSLPRQLKKRLEHAATDKDCDMQDIVIAALEKLLGQIERASNQH